MHVTPGVEVTTGPLGQGFANGVGMAMAERFLRERYGADVQDHRIYAIVSDGDLMEGIASEAASLAGHLGLGRLVYLYDDNDISLDGPTELSFETEDVDEALRGLRLGRARRRTTRTTSSRWRRRSRPARSEDERPTLIRVKSIIGYPSPQQAGHVEGARRARSARTRCARPRRSWAGIPTSTSSCPTASTRRSAARPEHARRSGTSASRRGATRTRELAKEWDAAWSGRPLPGVREALSNIDWEQGQARDALGRPEGDGGVQRLRPDDGRRRRRPERVDQDRVPAAATRSATRAPRPERNVFFGVREHGMGGAVNGMAAHGGIVRAYGSTFLQFADYMRGAIRLSALTGLQVAWVFTHDSVALGEDGPTHQPVEHLAALRAIPGLVVLRPGDANETAYAWRVILEDLEGPAVLVLSRQDLPVQANASDEGVVASGAYVLREARRRRARGDRRHRLGGLGRDRGGRAARVRGHRHARRLDALLGAVRPAGRRVPRAGPAAGAAERLGRGRHLDGLVEVRRRVGQHRALRRAAPRARGAREARHHARTRRRRRCASCWRSRPSAFIRGSR